MAGIAAMEITSLRSSHSRSGRCLRIRPIGFEKWLPAVWLICNAKNGISSYEVARSLGVTQKTAWFMMHRIRLAMVSKSFMKMGGSNGGPVEIDEAYIGGKPANKHISERMKDKYTKDSAGFTIRNPQYKPLTGRATKKIPVLWHVGQRNPQGSRPGHTRGPPRGLDERHPQRTSKRKSTTTRRAHRVSEPQSTRFHPRLGKGRFPERLARCSHGYVYRILRWKWTCHSTATVVVAGFIAPIDQWLKFEQAGKNVSLSSALTSLHMKHFAHSRGEYSKWKDDEKKRQAFLGKLIKIIKRRTARSFASAVSNGRLPQSGS